MAGLETYKGTSSGEQLDAAGTHSARTDNPHGVTAADVGASNPNILDNADFRNGCIVNQHTLTDYTAGGYCVDRWAMSWNGGAPHVVLLAGGLSIRNTGATYTVLTQFFEAARVDFTKTHTLSIVADGTLYSASGIIGTGVGAALTVNIPTGYMMVYKDTSSGHGCVNLIINGADTLVAQVKAEQGASSTLAYDPPADYGEELRKCQRYFERVYFASGTPGVREGTNKLKFSTAMKVRKRLDAPTVTPYPMYIVNGETDAGVFGNTVLETAALTGASSDMLWLYYNQAQTNAVAVGANAYVATSTGVLYCDVDANL